MNLLVCFFSLSMIILSHRTLTFQKKWIRKLSQSSFSEKNLPSSSQTRLFTSIYETHHHHHDINKEKILCDQESIRKWYPVYQSSKLFGGHYTIIECPHPSDFSVLDHALPTTNTNTTTTTTMPVERYSISKSITDPVKSQLINQSSEHELIDVELHQLSRSKGDSGIVTRTSSYRAQQKYTSSIDVEQQMYVHPDEIEFGRKKEERNLRRANIFIGGRIALRSCLTHLESSSSLSSGFGWACPPILSNEFGAPLLPSAISGSVSHKGDLVVGIVTAGTEYRVGVDIEKCHNKAVDRLYQRILTPSEQSRLGRLVNVSITPEEEVMLLFSFKEAVYKSIHPTVQRPVSFQEVSITVLDNGTATFQFELKSDEIFHMIGSWEKIVHSSGNYFVTFVSGKLLS